MASEIRANTLKNRVGLGTVSFTDTGAIVSGIVTATTFVGNLTGNPTGSGANLTNLPAGPYEVSVYDNNGCQLFTGATITEPIQDLMLSYTKIDKSCNGGINDGSIDLLVQGGTSPYTFSWSNGASTEDISSLADNGIINVSKMKEHYLNRPKDLKRCEGYEARWEHHKEWLHTIENPLYFRL